MCQAAMEFFRQTRAWREFVAQAAYADEYVQEFDVNAVARQVAANVTVMDVDDVWLSADGTRLKKRAVPAMDFNHPDWRSDTARTPTGYYMTPNRRLRVYPSIEAGAPMVWLDLELVLLPTLDTKQFPDFAFDIYGETISAGAIQRLKSQTGMEWSDPKVAEYFMKKFQVGIHEARVEKARRVTAAINDRRRRCFR